MFAYQLVCVGDCDEFVSAHCALNQISGSWFDGYVVGDVVEYVASLAICLDRKK